MVFSFYQLLSKLAAVVSKLQLWILPFLDDLPSLFFCLHSQNIDFIQSGDFSPLSFAYVIWFSGSFCRGGASGINIDLFGEGCQHFKFTEDLLLVGLSSQEVLVCFVSSCSWQNLKAPSPQLCAVTVITQTGHCVYILEIFTRSQRWHNWYSCIFSCLTMTTFFLSIRLVFTQCLLTADVCFN